MKSIDVFGFTKTLINCDSVTGKEAAVGDLVAEQLAALGLRVQKQQVEGDRCNLFATTAESPRVILCTHLDTVPPFIPASEDTEYIYGRGACDVKGGLAAMVCAAERLLQEGVTHFGLLFPCSEETDSAGARKSNEISPGPDFIIVAEPTMNKLAVGHKGMLTLRFTAKGKAAHSAFPELGESAVHTLLDFLQLLRATELPADAILGKPTLNVGKISGGLAHNIFAESAEATVSLRAATATQKLLDKVQSLTPPQISFEVQVRSEPQKLHTVSGFETTVVPFCTDIPHLRNWGKPLLIGPGDATLAHTAEERVEKKQLSEAVGIYTKLVKQLLP